MKPTYLLALGAFLTSVVAASPTAAQKPTPAEPTEQQKLKERVDTLESQLKEAQAKADRAAMEKDYIERIQTEAKAYYERAFNTQIAIVSIIGIIVALIGKFGVDHIVQSKLTEASATLREQIRKELADELQKLRDSNATQLNSAIEDLRLRSDYAYDVLSGMTSIADHRYADAIGDFRSALATYKKVEFLKQSPADYGMPILNNIFDSIEKQNPAQFSENAKKELADELYNGIPQELALLALKYVKIAPLIRERKDARPSAAPESVTAKTSSPATRPEGAAPGTPPAPLDKPTTE
jgi:hypothetical protein